MAISTLSLPPDDADCNGGSGGNRHSAQIAVAQSTEERTWELLSRLEDVTTVGRSNSQQWKAICPGHDDTKPSLSIGVGRDGEKLVLHCMAGCKTPHILQVLNLPITALFPDKKKGGYKHPGTKKSKSVNDAEIVAKYDYADSDGKLLYQVVRFEPKDFRQRRPKADGKPGWIWSVKDSLKVPYKLPRVTSAPTDQTIYIVEGEKDADNLHSQLGIIATSNAGGAGHWLATGAFTEPFRGRHVVILPDNDIPGQQHATDVARKLKEYAASIKVVDLPGLKEKQDVSDWIKAGGTAEQLTALVSAAPLWTDSETKPVEADDDPYRLARVILKAFRRVIYWRDEFYVMRETPRDPVYRKVSSSEWKPTVSRLIKAEFDRLNLDAITAAPGKTHICQKVVQSLVTNVIGALQSLCTIGDEIEMGSWIPVFRDASDQSSPTYQQSETQRESIMQRDWIVMQNGILKIDELLDGAAEYLIPHSPQFFTTLHLPFAFDWDAESQTWRDYLESSLENDDERISLLQEWAGYLLKPTTDQQKFLILEGEGSNGKSVYLAAIEAMLGPDNCSHVPLEIFGQRFQLTSSLGKRANICADCNELDSVAEGFLKSFTSGDRMQFDRKGLPAIDATPTARLMLATNTRPRFSDKSSGLWRRMLLVPFLREIPLEERIAGMDKPAWWMARPHDLSAIFNWALMGLARLQANEKFTIPSLCQTAVEEYRIDSNPVRMFFSDTIGYGDPETDWIVTMDVYHLYKQWAEAHGYRPLAANSFGREVQRAFPKSIRAQRRIDGSRIWIYQGLRRLQVF